ncbi:fungal-specific transcription factor domain-containing protein [Bisporella sp. PMI_857]|nr:fungal-specific transcription factor domain-containing protein [Bisporella sp. PMI_857]
MAERQGRGATRGDGHSSISGVTKDTPRRKPTACRRCHTKKIKCSGERPCQGCVTAAVADSCSYFIKDRTVKVSESYLRRLLADCENAKQNAAQISSPTIQSVSEDIQESPTETSVINPLIENRAWFVPYSAADIPIYIGEAACTAFATRFRQALDTSCSRSVHVPRTHYVPDTHLAADSVNPTPWPNEVKARLLVKVALSYVGRSYHVILASATFDRLDHIYQDPTSITNVDTGKFFALFALGEAYSNKSKSADSYEVPGLPYFIVASKVVQFLPERATLEYVEILLLLSFYSHILNRRHSAYHFVGSALRLSMTLGLHHNLPQHITIDPTIRQHRIRIWWTIYNCDRIWGSKLGHPASIQDSSITVELPSMTGLGDKQQDNFADPDYAIASIELSRITGDVISKVYSRNQTEPFVHSVRTILQSLKDWMTNLPDMVRLPHTDIATSAPRNITSLHLSFNQCVILVTRPVLLYVLKQSLHTSPSLDGPQTTVITPAIATLADTCIQTARHSNDLQAQAWINGTLSSFGYFDSHYIFSSAIVLAISSILDPTGTDKQAFETASQILQTLADNGNLSAAQFVANLESVQQAIDLYLQNMSKGGTEMQDRSQRDRFLGGTQMSTARTALDGTPIQDFLSGGDVTVDDFDFLNPLVGFEDESFLGLGLMSTGNSTIQ